MPNNRIAPMSDGEKMPQTLDISDRQVETLDLFCDRIKSYLQSKYPDMGCEKVSYLFDAESDTINLIATSTNSEVSRVLHKAGLMFANKMYGDYGIVTQAAELLRERLLISLSRV